MKYQKVLIVLSKWYILNTKYKSTKCFLLVSLKYYNNLDKCKNYILAQHILGAFHTLLVASKSEESQTSKVLLKELNVFCITCIFYNGVLSLYLILGMHKNQSYIYCTHQLGNCKHDFVVEFDQIPISGSRKEVI